MINRNEELLPQMQANFPHLYDVYNEKTILYALLSVYADKMKSKLSIIDRLHAMIGIDSTYDEDLEYRWGSLLGVYRNSGESYNDYRSRLLIIYSSLAGGTAEAIKYAIAYSIGISNNQEDIDKYIKVYDAWEYPDIPDTSLTNKDNVFLNQNFVTNTEIISDAYGHIICTVDLQANESIITMYDKIMNAINKTKASGIYPYLLFIYITNEIASLKYVEYAHDRIKDTMNDTAFMASCKDTYYPELNHLPRLNIDFMTNREWHVDNVDDWVDVVRWNAISESGVLTRVKSNTWSWDIGETNDTMITNQFADTDWKYDIIKALASDNINLNIGEISGFSVGELNTESGTMPPIGAQDEDSSVFDYAIFDKAIFGKYSNTADQFIDESAETIQETKAVCSGITTTWSYLGTNTAVLNDSLITNIFAESDACVDVIKYV